ncbi:MAG: hypothetical protein LQ346_004239 [Caloplaca aetnensis]|nr:MAG: hypothetical protein LQ346_004239 [Caloplaca aetnensis]
MAQDGRNPLTSVDIVRQNRGKIASTSAFKRPFEQISTVDSPVQFHQLVTSVPVIKNDFIRPSGERQALPLQPARLTASKVRKIPCAGTGDCNDVERAERLPAGSQPGSFLNPLLTLSHPRYGLPEILVKNFASLGVETIYPWQSSCLLGRGLLTGEKNLVYTAPTGGGKSLVADVLMLKKVLGSSYAKAILVLPYVALVQEKVNWLRKAVEGVQKDLQSPSQLAEAKRSGWHSSNTVRVVGFFGGSKTRATWADIDIAVCTFEKALYPEIVIKPMDNANSSQANMLVNTAIEQCTIDDLGVVVLDELHMIDDEHRGYLMELLATKILSLEHNVQLVGMSATLPVRNGQLRYRTVAKPCQNTQLLAKWLDAKYYESKYRPVPIKEYLVLENSVHPVSALSAFSRAASQPRGSSLSSTPSMIIESSTHNELRHPTINAVVALAVDTASQGYGALVFCGGRQACQTTAFLISQAMPACNGELLEQRQDIVHDLRGLSTGLDETLEKTVPRGVAFHHAGLTTEEREILARAYDTRVISVIVATCSLAAGINLPARRVILNGARMGREPIGPAMLRQMRGRAGRKGKDDFGESFLCCQKADIDDVVQLIEADLPKVGSSMTPERRGIKR